MFERINVEIALLRHSTQRVYVEEGWGGQPLERWPVYGFFVMYIQGQRSGAVSAFVDWYAQQLEKYRTISKLDGGMRCGSLDRLIARRQSEGIPTSAAIEERVMQRFALIDSVRQRGYVPTPEDPAVGTQRSDGCVVLDQGHHRAAALLALGIATFPVMKVYPNRSIRNLARALRR